MVLDGAVDKFWSNICSVVWQIGCKEYHRACTSVVITERYCVKPNKGEREKIYEKYEVLDKICPKPFKLPLSLKPLSDLH